MEPLGEQLGDLDGEWVPEPDLAGPGPVALGWIFHTTALHLPSRVW